MKHALRQAGRQWAHLATLLFTLQVGIAVVGVPGSLYRWIATRNEGLRGTPGTIVVLGGGIPSESGLIRTYYAAEYGRGLMGTTFIVALPTDADPDTSSVGRMRDELVLRGIPRDAIRMETAGLNTYEQARNVRRMLGDAALDEPLLVVTSPTHARRSLLCFRKVGFRAVGCRPAENTEQEADPGRWTWERYGFWITLVLEVNIVRELSAMLVYKAQGWI